MPKLRRRKQTNSNRARFSHRTSAAETELKNLKPKVGLLKSRINRATDPVLKQNLQQGLRELQKIIASCKRRLRER